MNLSNQEMETVLRCVDKVFDFRAERDRLRDILAALEAENKGLAARVAELERELEQAKADRARAAMDARNPLLARVAELEAREKQAREDEAWANERTVLVEFQPVTSGWYASAPDGVVGINATAPTIHGALRALREKMEGAR